MGIIVELFTDLNKSDPWVRVLFTYPTETYQWVKKSGLCIAVEDSIEKEG